MIIEIHPSSERGISEHGGLHSRHSFSFANYYNPNREGFGLLRVLNEDIVEPGRGFGTHHHKNMEIVSIVLEGALEHKDSMGNSGIIPAGDVQAISAGRGVEHSEHNASNSDIVHFLQIWVHTKEKDIEPRHEQKSFPAEMRKNALLPVVSGIKSDETIYIHQDAGFFVGSLDEGISVSHKTGESKLGVYVFTIKGGITIDGYELEDGDAAAITDSELINLTTTKKSDVLIIEVPMS
ncbi:MAG: pirin family protein [Thermodesulfobacteriota bacterium]